jgi:hypothetical protein
VAPDVIEEGLLLGSSLYQQTESKANMVHIEKSRLRSAISCHPLTVNG